MLVEVCVNDANIAAQAAQLGAQRVELCAHLEAGGITPSAALIEQTARLCAAHRCRVHVMIRPRPGDFVYNSDELGMMSRDIEIAARFGAQGVVFGLLTPARTIDTQQTSSLVAHAHALNLQVTFHRAFDLCADVSRSVNELLTCDIDHLLTSGRSRRAADGVPVLEEIVRAVKRRFAVIAAAGIHAGNVGAVIDAGVDAVHLSVHQQRSTDDAFGFGAASEFDADKLRCVLQEISNWTAR